MVDVVLPGYHMIEKIGGCPKTGHPQPDSTPRLCRRDIR